MNQIQIAGVVILAVFYGCYFFKLFSQKRKGIKTDRLGKGTKDFSTANAERSLKRTTVAIAVIQICSLFINDPNMSISVNGIIHYIGFGVACLGIIFFISAISAMGNNWRAGVEKDHQTQLVINGIYRYSRNPAFVGFDLLYIGFTMAFPNWILLIVSCMGIVMMHFQIVEEERHLPEIFGEEYIAYKKQTPRYFLFF